MVARPLDVVRFIARSTRRIAVTAVGGAVLLAGLAMLVLPGPGFLVIVLGFAILGTEYAWAAAALDRTKSTAVRAGNAAKRVVRRR
jgi:hypothetical protein